MNWSQPEGKVLVGKMGKGEREKTNEEGRDVVRRTDNRLPNIAIPYRFPFPPFPFFPILCRTLQLIPEITQCTVS